jgi:hypothetical protein
MNNVQDSRNYVQGVLIIKSLNKYSSNYLMRAFCPWIETSWMKTHVDARNPIENMSINFQQLTRRSDLVVTKRRRLVITKNYIGFLVIF